MQRFPAGRMLQAGFNGLERGGYYLGLYDHLALVTRSVEREPRYARLSHCSEQH